MHSCPLAVPHHGLGGRGAAGVCAACGAARTSPSNASAAAVTSCVCQLLTVHVTPRVRLRDGRLPAWRQERLVCHVQTHATFEIGKPPRLVGDPVFNVDTFDYGCSVPVGGYAPPCGVQLQRDGACGSRALLRSTTCSVVRSVFMSTSLRAAGSPWRTLEVFGDADIELESTEGTGTACAHSSTA